MQQLQNPGQDESTAKKAGWADAAGVGVTVVCLTSKVVVWKASSVSGSFSEPNIAGAARVAAAWLPIRVGVGQQLQQAACPPEVVKRHLLSAALASAAAWAAGTILFE